LPTKIEYSPDEYGIRFLNTEQHGEYEREEQFHGCFGWDYTYLAQIAVSTAMGANRNGPSLGRMKMLEASSGNDATFAQNFDQTPLLSR
jgi:hypothetical protein